MFITSIVMIVFGLLPLFTSNSIGLSYLIFGFLGGFMAHPRFYFLQNPENYKNMDNESVLEKWLALISLQ